MSLIRMNEIKEMSPVDRKDKLKELSNELMHERGVGAMGGAMVSPGKIRALRKNVARLMTVMRQEGEI